MSMLVTPGGIVTGTILPSAAGAQRIMEKWGRCEGPYEESRFVSLLTASMQANSLRIIHALCEDYPISSDGYAPAFSNYLVVITDSVVCLLFLVFKISIN